MKNRHIKTDKKFAYNQNASRLSKKETGIFIGNNRNDRTYLGISCWRGLRPLFETK